MQVTHRFCALNRDYYCPPPADTYDWAVYPLIIC